MGCEIAVRVRRNTFHDRKKVKLAVQSPLTTFLRITNDDEVSWAERTGEAEYTEMEIAEQLARKEEFDAIK
jgi:hypothetical protein